LIIEVFDECTWYIFMKTCWFEVQIKIQEKKFK